jgi:hypothetical protein
MVRRTCQQFPSKNVPCQHFTSKSANPRRRPTTTVPPDSALRLELRPGESISGFESAFATRRAVRTLYWRRAIRQHWTAHPAPPHKIGKPPCLRGPLRRAVSGWPSVRRNGRRNIAARGGSMSRQRAESHCTPETGHQLLTDWTEIAEIDTRSGKHIFNVWAAARIAYGPGHTGLPLPASCLSARGGARAMLDDSANSSRPRPANSRFERAPMR